MEISDIADRFEQQGQMQVVDSANHRETSWMPTGSPSLLVPNRNVIAGRPVRLNGDVVLKICCADTVSPLMTNFDNPCGCADIGVTGQRKASYFWKKAAKPSFSNSTLCSAAR